VPNPHDFKGGNDAIGGPLQHHYFKYSTTGVLREIGSDQ
jgi:hypothetical protein